MTGLLKIKYSSLNLLWSELVKGLLFFVTCLFSISTFADNTWYSIRNFEGSVGPYPIAMSIQYIDNSKENIMGSYFYKNRSTPIPLHGLIKDDFITMCEVSGSKDYSQEIIQGDDFYPEKCEFNLRVNGKELIGSWVKNTKKFDVKLTLMQSWDKKYLTGDSLRIPYWGSDDDYAFFGVYKEKGGKLSVNDIEVVEKKTGDVIQHINPQSDKCEFGFYMTYVYQNIERSVNGSYLNCYSTRGDITSDLRFNYRSKKYTIVDQ